MLKLTIIPLLILTTLCTCTQTSIDNYTGKWKGKLTNLASLNFEVTIDRQGKDAIFNLSNCKNILSEKFEFSDQINLAFEDGFGFKGEVDAVNASIVGFMKTKGDLYPITLYKNGNVYKGKWNLSYNHHLQPSDIKLSIEEVNDGGYTVYPKLGSYWVSDFKHNKDNISFKDYKTNLTFKGQLKPTEIIFTISLATKDVSEAIFKTATIEEQTKEANEIYDINDGLVLSNYQLKLPKMEEEILSNVLVGMEGIIIAKNGKIIYEKYFAGFDATTPHDTRSASKSVASAIIGIAIDDGIIESVDEKLYDYIPKKYQYTEDSLKSQITIQHLLTMSAGLDVNDKASEEYYQDISEDEWLKTVLSAPIKHKPGTYTDYGSANPFLLGVYLSNRLETPLEFYMHEKLFTPLGITNYIMNTDDTNIIPYFGGGLHLTPRDLLKFGLLYLNDGVYNGQQIISKHWVNESFKKHTRLQDVSDKNEYGYFWWHDSYSVDGSIIETIEARGAGGQFIFVVPELEAIVVITAGNYRNSKGNQSREIFRDHIIPAINN
jgi:CubicO group peptidase (beta-lactamase class C family)